MFRLKSTTYEVCAIRRIETSKGNLYFSVSEKLQFSELAKCGTKSHGTHLKKVSSEAASPALLGTSPSSWRLYRVGHVTGDPSPGDSRLVAMGINLLSCHF